MFKFIICDKCLEAISVINNSTNNINHSCNYSGEYFCLISSIKRNNPILNVFSIFITDLIIDFLPYECLVNIGYLNPIYTSAKYQGKDLVLTNYLRRNFQTKVKYIYIKSSDNILPELNMLINKYEKYSLLG